MPAREDSLGGGVGLLPVRSWRRSRMGASGEPTRRIRRGFGMSIFPDLDFMGLGEDMGREMDSRLG